MSPPPEELSGTPLAQDHTPMPPGAMQITPPRTTIRTPTEPQDSEMRDITMKSVRISPKSPTEHSLYRSSRSEHLSRLHHEAQALLLNPNDRSFSEDPTVKKYLPYAPSSTKYELEPELAKEYEFLPSSAVLTSVVRLDKQANNFQKIYRRLGRVFYKVAIPEPKNNRYPSRACKQWAQHVLDLLDKVVTFRPTCRITTQRIPAQEINHWPEYGRLHIAFSDLINRTVSNQEEIDAMLPLPQWPAQECLFHAHAFEVAAVSFRDQMEQAIQRLFDIMSKHSSNPAHSPIISTGEFSDVDPMQVELRDLTMQLDPEAMILVIDEAEATRTDERSFPEERGGSGQATQAQQHSSGPADASGIMEELIQQIGALQTQTHSLGTTPPGEPPSKAGTRLSTTRVPSKESRCSSYLARGADRPMDSPGSRVSAADITHSSFSQRLAQSTQYPTTRSSPSQVALIEEDRVHCQPRRPTPRPRYDQVPPVSSEGTATWVHTPSGSQETRREPSGSNRLDNSNRERFSQLLVRPVPIPFEEPRSNEQIHSRASSDIPYRLSSPSSIREEEPLAPTNQALGQTNTIMSVRSAATRTLLGGGSTNRRDAPPHANFIANRTSLGEPQIPTARIYSAEGSDKESTELRNDQQQETAGVSGQTRRIPLTDSAKNETSNVSRRANFMAPLRPHLAARPVPVNNPINRDELPVHIRSCMASSRRFTELFQDFQPRDQLRDQLVPIQEGGGGDDPTGNSNSGPSSSRSQRSFPNRGNGPRPPEGPGDNPNNDPVANAARARPFRPAPVHFDTKLKPEIIPEWNGETKGLSRWIISINNIAEYSNYMCIQLGQQVPLRFTGRALRWFNALDKAYRRQITIDWPSLRRAITIHFMNRTFMERNKAKALYAKFRDKNHPHELPEDYVIRKMEALTILSDWTDSELITEIMNSAPEHWALYINTSVVTTWDDFLDKIAWHEEKLLNHEGSNTTDIQRQLNEMKAMLRKLDNPRQSQNQVRAQQTISKPIGWHKGSSLPPYPKDDNTVSKGKTPKDKKARPCRHCGSMMHWDWDCKYAKKNSRNVRAQMAEASEEERAAQEAYDDLCDDAYMEESESESEELEQDFCEPLQPLTASTNACASEPSRSNESSLEGESVREDKEKVFSGYVLPKLPTRRSWGKKLKLATNTFSSMIGNEITLKRLMSQPPGTAFFGSKATIIKGWVQNSYGPKKRITFDSGSEITLINKTLLKSLDPPPKVRTGQKLRLIQVTSNSSLSQYVTVPLVFETDNGPVCMIVEAYIVPNMNTPFILGTDFASQYQLSLVRSDKGTRIVFGDTGRSIQVEESDSTPRVDKEGNLFLVEVAQGFVQNGFRRSRARKAYKKKVKEQNVPAGSAKVKILQTVTIPAHTIKLLKVKTKWTEGQAEGFIDRNFNLHRTGKEVFAVADSVISRNNPKVQISNFSDKPVKLQAGEVIGYMHNPREYLARESKLSNQEKADVVKYAKLVQAVANRKPKEKPTGENEELTRNLEGGPKTADLLEEVQFSEHLTKEQRLKLEAIVRRNELAFGLNGRLGNYDAQVEIKLRPGTKEISLAPYSASPAKREVIDRQIEEWLWLEVIEPSKSAWGFPVIVVYRNSKPRVCIDYQRLNAVSIPDEYPLPKQTNILHALEGAQWLSTLDALAGFTQLSIKEEDRDKTAFRCHQGLFRFNRLPFGYRNGPPAFQQEMNAILAPFLWIFALVYIDDIVIYSTRFEDHCQHLEEVFQAIIKADITLSPKKCHLGYQLLLLLGQKVSRLGLSTHKEKVDAIIQLESPKNIPTLQTFLGMMTYFASYIPFYAWIVAPLFKLLRKTTKWNWGETEQKAFELSKQALVSAPVMAYPIIGKPFWLYTDTCDYGLGAVLQQVQPIKIKDLKGTQAYKYLKGEYEKGNPVPKMAIPASKQKDNVTKGDKWDSRDFEETIVHVEQVIAYWSRILKEAERNYSPTEREALALKEALVKLQVYLEGSEFIAITDHAALTWSKTYNNVNRRLMTWGLVFSAYPGMQIVHQAGRVHNNADPVSRLQRRIPYQTGPLTDISTPLKLSHEEDPLRNMYKEIGDKFEQEVLEVVSAYTKASEKRRDRQEENVWIATAAGHIPCQIAKSYSIQIAISPTKVKKFTQAYLSNNHFSKVLTDLRTNSNTSKPTYTLYRLGDNGLLYFVDNKDRSRLCVPKELQIETIKENHDGLNQGAHAGFAKTYQRIASVYYWPKMKAGHRRHGPRGYLQSIPIPQQPFEVVSMDFIMDLPLSDSFNAILVVVDKLTKYAHFLPCTTQINEVETAKLFHNNIWCQYGLPRQIITDRDARWTGAFWEHLVSLLGIKRALTTAYHPQADGQTEIMNQTLEIAIRAFTNPMKDNWKHLLAGFAHSYNTSMHTLTQQTPAFLLRGFQPLTTEDLLAQTAEYIKRPSRESESAEEFKESIDTARDLAKDALKIAQNLQQKYYNRNRTYSIYKPGDLVLINPHLLRLLKKEKGKGDKLNMRYEGPFEILERVSPVSYRLRLPGSYRIHPVINIAHIKNYKQSPKEFGNRPTKHIP
ncbi:Retrovirus-related Pol polyprotein from transposon [Rhizoctonia solani]|uniref:RNA-directed DNA polymerase n=1 Tax=Rhizoctonia solani TaxID=456999 RepID=A0A8H8NW46_9AGAM|nr:Retrovirus-related Pol polyprotein from transposon [Rhizoctonia solani]QRW19822.1 Retrovirus-related Pol polyprotein from transposon [Rhizoctonia solani]